jgi:superfamily II DNA helicase RecQ
MAGMIYARLLFEGTFETQTQKEKYRQVSQEWHRFLGFKSATEGFGINTGMKRKKSHWEQVNKEMQELRWKQLKYANVQAMLEMILGAGAKFRGKQKPAIDAIMQGQSPVMVIMGTGGGKSMLFMLPAAVVPGGTTIVVVPLVALQGDLQERCEKAGISSVVWSSRQPYESASIVFVTPESAVSKTFAGFINRLQELRQLDRIVVDECHTILDGSPGFRPKLRQLGQLAMYGAQMVYLTATLPPRDEDEFRRLMHIPTQGLQLFRDRTTRKNVAYQVQDVDVPESTNANGWGADSVGFDAVICEAILQLVQQKLEQYPAPAKIIIYCSNIKGAEGLGDVLGCDVYHRNVDSKDGKFRRLDNWRKARDNGGLGQGRVIVATNALGLGVDVPDIRVVIHVGKVWALKDYAQESGRAGRDGEKSEAIIVRGVGVGGENYEDKKDAGQVDIAEFIQGSVCRRVILDQVMDAPRVRVGCEEGEERCDVCTAQWDGGFDDSGIGSSSQEVGFPSSPPVLSQQDRMEFHEQEQQRNWVISGVRKQRCKEGREVKELVEYFEEWCGKCTLCHWRGGPNPWHRIEECIRDEAHEIQMQLADAIKGIRYEDYSCCFSCGVPQGICDRWDQMEERGWWRQKEDGRCQYSGVLIRAVMTMLVEGIDEVVEDTYTWIKGFGVDITDRKEVYKWMGQRVEWGGYEATRLTQVFHRLAGQHRV